MSGYGKGAEVFAVEGEDFVRVTGWGELQVTGYRLQVGGVTGWEKNGTNRTDGTDGTNRTDGRRTLNAQVKMERKKGNENERETDIV